MTSPPSVVHVQDTRRCQNTFMDNAYHNLPLDCADLGHSSQQISKNRHHAEEEGKGGGERIEVVNGEGRDEVEDQEDNTLTLENVLGHPQSREAFRCFLEEQKNDEMIQFLDLCDQFEAVDDCNEKDRFTLAEHIVRKSIEVNGVCTLNICDEIRQQILDEWSVFRRAFRDRKKKSRSNARIGSDLMSGWNNEGNNGTVLSKISSKLVRSTLTDGNTMITLPRSLFSNVKKEVMLQLKQECFQPFLSKYLTEQQIQTGFLSVSDNTSIDECVNDRVNAIKRLVRIARRSNSEAQLSTYNDSNGSGKPQFKRAKSMIPVATGGFKAFLGTLQKQFGSDPENAATSTKISFGDRRRGGIILSNSSSPLTLQSIDSETGSPSSSFSLFSVEDWNSEQTRQHMDMDYEEYKRQFVDIHTDHFGEMLIEENIGSEMKEKFTKKVQRRSHSHSDKQDSGKRRSLKNVETT